MGRVLLFSPLLMLALVSSPAFAQPRAAQRVVVQQFVGPRGGAARASLISNLEEAGVVVVPDEEVRAARERLHFDRRIRAEQFVELARELDVSAFIDGRVVRHRRAWSLSVRVRNAADGAEVGSEGWSGSTAASLNGVRRNGHARLSSHLASTRAPTARVAEPEGESPWYSARDDERPPVEQAPTPAPAPPSSTRYDALRLSLVGGTLFRWFDSTVQVYATQRRMAPLDPASELLDESRRYQSGGIGHFELGGQAELYPGAFGDQPFPYLGVLISFTHSVGVQSNGFDRNTGDPVSVPTSQLDFLAALRGRVRFGAERREPELHLDLGFGMFEFNLGLAELQRIEPDTIIPPLQHGYVHLGGGLTYGIVPTYLSIGVDFAYRFGTHVGGDTRNVWGTDTGPSDGLIFGVELRTEIPEIVQGAFIALRFQYFQFTTNFQGQVGCARAEECAGYMDPWSDRRLWEVWPVTAPGPGENPDLNDVIGGPQSDVVDNYVRLQLAAGYAFH